MMSIYYLLYPVRFLPVLLTAALIYGLHKFFESAGRW